MKVLKVVLAAVVIFAAGAVAGGMFAHSRLTAKIAAKEQKPNNYWGHKQRAELLDRMQRELNLSADQRDRIGLVLEQSQERMKALWESIAPEAQQEFFRTQDLIKAELDEEQKKRFDSVFKYRHKARKNREEPSPTEKSGAQADPPGVQDKSCRAVPIYQWYPCWL